MRQLGGRGGREISWEGGEEDNEWEGKGGVVVPDLGYLLNAL